MADNSKIIKVIKDFVEDREKWNNGPAFNIAGLKILASKWRRPEGFICMIDVAKNGNTVLCKSYSYEADGKNGYYELEYYEFNSPPGLFQINRNPTPISRETFIDRMLMLGDKSRDFIDFVLWSDL